MTGTESMKKYEKYDKVWTQIKSMKSMIKYEWEGMTD